LVQEENPKNFEATTPWVTALFAGSGGAPRADYSWCYYHSDKGEGEQQIVHRVFTFQGKTRLQIDSLSIGRNGLSFIRVRENPQKVQITVSERHGRS
jgi:hypothetical protein